MAVLWKKLERGEWEAEELNGAAVEVGDGVVIARAGVERVLIAEAGALVWVNGERVGLGIRVLRDRDAIAVGVGGKFFFSSESLARVERFSETRGVICARCKGEICGGDVVRCPKCGAIHHQTGEFSCWTYAERCAVCEQGTGLDGVFGWTPEGME